MPIINSVAASNVGNVRENNEDNFFLNGKTLDTSITGTAITSDQVDSGLFAVCDGMGGEEHGETAAVIAVDTLNEYYHQILEENTSFDEWLELYADEANARICAEIEKNGGKRMGTTFAVLYIQDQTAYISNIGDSRAYLFRNHQLTQLSKDHTQIRRLLDMGILTAEHAKTHPDRHKLTQHLGIFPDEMVIEAFAAEPMQIEGEDVFLLCSDGLTDMLEDQEIETILRQYASPQDTALELIAAALQSGGKDNVTVVVVKVCDLKESHKSTVPEKRKRPFSFFN